MYLKNTVPQDSEDQLKLGQTQTCYCRRQINNMYGKSLSKTKFFILHNTLTYSNIQQTH